MAASKQNNKQRSWDGMAETSCCGCLVRVGEGIEFSVLYWVYTVCTVSVASVYREYYLTLQYTNQIYNLISKILLGDRAGSLEKIHSQCCVFVLCVKWQPQYSTRKELKVLLWEKSINKTNTYGYGWDWRYFHRARI